jgi:hypothetical protein
MSISVLPTFSTCWRRVGSKQGRSAWRHPASAVTLATMLDTGLGRIFIRHGLESVSFSATFLACASAAAAVSACLAQHLRGSYCVDLTGGLQAVVTWQGSGYPAAICVACARALSGLCTLDLKLTGPLSIAVKLLSLVYCVCNVYFLQACTSLVRSLTVSGMANAQVKAQQCAAQRQLSHRMPAW